MLKTSGATDLIMNLVEDADDTDFSPIHHTSEDFLNTLTAKLLVTGPTGPYCATRSSCS